MQHREVHLVGLGLGRARLRERRVQRQRPKAHAGTLHDIDKQPVDQQPVHANHEGAGRGTTCLSLSLSDFMSIPPGASLPVLLRLWLSRLLRPRCGQVPPPRARAVAHQPRAISRVVQSRGIPITVIQNYQLRFVIHYWEGPRLCRAAARVRLRKSMLRLPEATSFSVTRCSQRSYCRACRRDCQGSRTAQENLVRDSVNRGWVIR